MPDFEKQFNGSDFINSLNLMYSLHAIIMYVGETFPEFTEWLINEFEKYELNPPEAKQIGIRFGQVHGLIDQAIAVSDSYLPAETAHAIIDVIPQEGYI